MKKNNLKEWGMMIMLIVALFIIPFALNQYHQKVDKADYYSDVDEDFNLCIERAKRDSRDEYWCGEIKRSSKLAYQSATYASKDSILFIVIFTSLIILAISVRNLVNKIKTIE